jgi:hypothetical protein
MSWREELHPRDPATGEFVGEEWAGKLVEMMKMSRFPNDPAGRQAILERYQHEKPVEGVILTGEQGKAEVLRYATGPGVVKKTFRRSHDIMPIEEAINNELQFSVVAQALDAPVAAVVRNPRGNRSILMAAIEGTEGVDLPATTDQMRPIRSHPGVRLGLVDLLFLNDDRAANYIVTPADVPVGFDNSQTMGVQHPRSVRQPTAGGWQAAYANPFIQAHFLRGSKWIDNPLTPGDVDEVARRLLDLRDRGIIRDDQHAQAAKILEFIRPHAKGTMAVYR